MEYIFYVITALIAVFVIYTYINIRRLKKMPLAPDSEKVIHLTRQNFEHQTKSGIALVDFWADWCMPCKMMAPVLSELADEVSDEIKICKVDVQQYPELSSKFGVRGIPTLVLLKNGKEINRFVGVKQKDYLLKQINLVK